MTNRIPLVVKDGTVNEIPAGDSLLVEQVSLDTAAARTPLEGEIAWDAESGTALVGLNGGALTLRAGQDLHYRVTNNTGVSIAMGMLVMAVGTAGASGKILIAPWDGATPGKYILGITAEAIADDADGYVVAFGKLRGIQTNGGNYSESWTDGDILFAGASGGLTKIMPAAPEVKVTVAIVVDSHATNGELFVRPTYGSNIGEDELVELVDPQEGEVLVWNAASGRFENELLTTRIASTTSGATITPVATPAQQYNVTALAVAATFATPSGTPTDGQRLLLRIKDDGTARALTWTQTSGAYRAVGVPLPSTTVASKVLYVGCIWNAQDSYWDITAVAQQ